LQESLSRYGAPEFHARQVYRWLYARRRYQPEEWTDLPRALRDRLGRAMRVSPGRIAGQTHARDGTVKYRNELSDGTIVESVSMLQSDRVTLCISSQVGCALGCDFCLTAKMGLVRHLDPGEIAGQVALIQDEQRLEDRPFRVVFMGMGEPLHNYESVVAAFRLLVDPEGFGLSRRRVTISTSGLAPAIERLADQTPRPRLAVSLNATTDEVRDKIMPINRKYPLHRLLRACRRFVRNSGERITFEYVLLAGINDSERDAERLARITRSVRCKVNLIPFNPVPEWLDYRPPASRKVERLRDRLRELDVPVSIRWSRGADARAACGQLALLPETGGPEP